MNFQHTSRGISRRDFLKVVAAAGVTAATAAVLDTYEPWVNYDQQTHLPVNVKNRNVMENDPMLSLVQYATQAANGHNTQPWKFALADHAIRIYPDRSRSLTVVDPQDRELWISLGCALENLVVAARAMGYAAEISYPDAADFIDVRLAADTPRKDALFDAIPRRQNTRSLYDGKPVASPVLDQIHGMVTEPGVVLRYANSTTDLETLLEYVNGGNLQQYADKAFLDELVHWLRFNKKEALEARDGLYTLCTGNPEVPRWLGQVFVRGMKPQQQADADAKKVRSASGMVVIASENDNRAGWVRTGQVYERLGLLLTSLDIKSSLLNQPIEVAGLRPQLSHAIGLGAALPQLLMRFGYASAMPRSLRRPVEQVIMQP